ncbi:S8 family serine peptidase [Sinorhizobium meliloti]|uniref:S8 family serine peptidase n=1 Tax=Rhizobium meliloti TaxID=382 RepID=UPI003137BFA5
MGDLAPSARTASWQSYWPIKPDVVYEGGNWFMHGAPPPMKHPALAPLTTDHQYPQRAFTTCGETSAATALASRDITALWSDYPELCRPPDGLARCSPMFRRSHQRRISGYFSDAMAMACRIWNGHGAARRMP